MTTPDNKKNPGDESDDLLKKLRQAAGNDVAGKARRALKNADTFGRNVNDVAQGMRRFGQTAGWLKTNILSPVWSILSPVFGRGARAYGRLWDRVVNVRDSDGDMVFSKKRAGIMVLATAFAAVAAYEAVPEMARSTMFAAWWAVSNKSEPLVLNKSSDPLTGIFSAKGCHSWPCDSENTIDFKIDDSIFHDAHRIATHGELFYPSLIAGAVLDVPSICQTDYYGWRSKILARWGHTYPRLMDVNGCIPIPDGFPEGPITQESYEQLKSSMRAADPAQQAVPAAPQAPAPL